MAALGLLVLRSIPPGLAQKSCSPVSTGPEGEIAVGVRSTVPVGGGQRGSGGGAGWVVSAV